MRNELVPCQGCNRHVRVADAVCPFCEALVGARPSPVVVGKLRSRSAMMMFGASIAVAGCGGASGTPETPPDAPVDGVPSDSDSAGPDDPDGASPEDPGTVVAMYGAPAPEDLPPDGPDDEGGMGTKYGAPPPPEE